VENIYENIGEDQNVVEDGGGWSSSEFEEYEDDDEEDHGSIGAQSQTSQGSVDRVVNKTKKLFRRKVPARLSWGKSGADVQSMVS